MNNKLVKFGRVAWVVGVIFAGLCLLLIISLFALSNPDWDLGEAILTIIAGGTYVTGLLIAQKRPLTGGLLSFILPVAAIGVVLYSIGNMDISPEMAGQFRKSGLLFLVYLLPGILHLIYWWLKKRSDKKRSDRGKF